MNPFWRWSQAIAAAFLLVVVATSWILLAPVQFGGQASFVIISGNSMEPAFHYGDFVIVRRAADYQVGDVVAYRSQELGAYVFHRIIGENLGRFILKGDHNSWTDAYQPLQEELLGKLWFHLPGFGKFVKWLRTPFVMTIIVAGTGVFLMTTLAKGSSANWRRTNRKLIKDWLNKAKDWIYRPFIAKPRPGLSPEASTKRTAKDAKVDRMTPGKASHSRSAQQARTLGKVIEILFFALGFLTLACLVLGFFAFTRPVWTEVSRDIEYQQTGRFSYNAVSSGGVYDAGTLTTRQPVFTKLNCLVNLEFDYAVHGNQMTDLKGTHQLTAIIREETSNWSRTFPIESETSFDGQSFTKTVILNLCKLQAAALAMEEKTGLHSLNYSIIIDPRVKVNGKIDGKALQDSFEPNLVFHYDMIQAHIFNDDPKVDPLNPVKKGLVKDLQTVANTLSVFSLKPEISKVRTVSLVGLGISLAGLIALWAYLAFTARRSQEAYIQLKYGSMLLDARDGLGKVTSPAIDLLTIEELAKLAEKHNELILHEKSDLVNRYSIKVDGIIYRYTDSRIDGHRPSKATKRRHTSRERTG